jgi:putative ABC transport system permease protein
MIEGDPEAAAAELRAGGAVAISEALAEAQNLEVGDPLTLPTPTGPTRLRVAAVTTNLGWPPGAVILNRADYQRSWATDKPTALQVDLQPGSDPDEAAAVVRRAVATPALRVQTTQQRTEQYAALSRQGLRSLQQIATLLLIAAGLTIALALTAALAQRRQRIAQLKIDGFSHLQLWRAVLCESTIVLILGATVGALLGLYGHALASHWLKATTSFPAPFSLGAEQTLTTITLLATIALVTLAAPGWLATRVPPLASFDP